MMRIVAELGINHNGSLDTAKKMIEVAKLSGSDFVKFQKRTIDLCYTQEELSKPRESPWGTTTREQKEGLEFGQAEYDAIDTFTEKTGVQWFASPWDYKAAEFLSQYTPPYMKIASACITDMQLLEAVKDIGIPVILSTGMSTRDEVKRAVDFFGNQCEYILVCTSTYPTKPEEINLNFIRRLRAEFGIKHKIGFSNHSPGLTFCIAAAALGAEMIEFHLTLDRAMYGSDQAASIEPQGSVSLVKHCRDIERGMGTGEWIVFDSEIPIREKLRRYI